MAALRTLSSLRQLLLLVPRPPIVVRVVLAIAEEGGKVSLGLDGSIVVTGRVAYQHRDELVEAGFSGGISRVGTRYRWDWHPERPVTARMVVEQLEALRPANELLASLARTYTPPSKAVRALRSPDILRVYEQHAQVLVDRLRASKTEPRTLDILRTTAWRTPNRPYMDWLSIETAGVFNPEIMVRRVRTDHFITHDHDVGLLVTRHHDLATGTQKILRQTLLP